MELFIFIVLIIVLTFVLTILINISYNFVFLNASKPIIWVSFMGFLSFIYFYIGSQFENSVSVVLLSTIFAFIIKIPPKSNDSDIENDKNELVNEIYNDMGIKGGKLKYRIGLGLYLIGAIIGWALFYGKLVIINNN